MISLRFIPATCALLAIALVPTIIHSYSNDTFDDGRSTAKLPNVLAAMPSTPTDRSATWGKRRFDSDDWIERDFRAAEGGAVQLTVVRTTDAKAVYHHPELAIADRTSFVGAEVQYFPQRPEIPVHVLKPGPGVAAAGLYVLHYDTRFIADPIGFQIRTAGELLFSRRRPMTLFFVLDQNQRDKTAADSPAAAVLFAAINAFVNQQGDAAR